MNNLIASLRLLLVTSAVCVVGYTGLFLLLGRTLTPETAEGSLLRTPEGQVVGSRPIAQAFTRDDFFHPRPSDVDHDGAAAGGSNFSPTNPVLLERRPAEGSGPIPQELLTASGSGLDPHITESGARFQAERIAAARNLPTDEIHGLITRHLRRPGGRLLPEPIVNVLELNLELNQMESP